MRAQRLQAHPASLGATSAASRVPPSPTLLLCQLFCSDLEREGSWTEAQGVRWQVAGTAALSLGPMWMPEGLALRVRAAGRQSCQLGDG